MNERIQNLAQQANPDIFKEFDQEDIDFCRKFAELIVGECARICDELQDIPATEPRHCAEDIRIHFGVKE